MDYLVHHGIKGQKWGVRRFQNPDGTLTDAGKKRYATNGKSIPHDQLVGSNEIGKDHERAKQAVRTGLYGLSKIDSFDYDLKRPGYLNDYGTWFLYEDQTIGLAQIADMVNRGIPKNKILNTIKEAQGTPYTQVYDENNPGLFELYMGYFPNVEKYIDGCIEYKQKDPNDVYTLKSKR